MSSSGDEHARGDARRAHHVRRAEVAAADAAQVDRAPAPREHQRERDRSDEIGEDDDRHQLTVCSRSLSDLLAAPSRARQISMRQRGVGGPGRREPALDRASRDSTRTARRSPPLAAPPRRAVAIAGATRASGRASDADGTADPRARCRAPPSTRRQFPLQRRQLCAPRRRRRSTARAARRAAETHRRRRAPCRTARGRHLAPSASTTTVGTRRRRRRRGTRASDARAQARPISATLASRQARAAIRFCSAAIDRVARRPDRSTATNSRIGFELLGLRHATTANVARPTHARTGASPPSRRVMLSAACAAWNFTISRPPKN